MLQQSMLDNGELDYELNPTRYVVSFHCGVSNGKEYPRKVLNQILQEYASYYGKNHVNTSLAANPVSDITTKGYDYLEMAEVMDDTLTNIAEQLSNKVEWPFPSGVSLWFSAAGACMCPPEAISQVI